MNRYENMGPFKPVSLKGGARINAVPTFVHQLPLTLGGIAGEDGQSAGLGEEEGGGCQDTRTGHSVIEG